MEGQVHVGVRAAVHALDAALAEQRRALALAASQRERERMARGREVKAAARLSEETLEQPVERPMRALRLGETWIEVDRVRHPLAAGVRAAVVEGELRVRGDGWSARLPLAPGEGPAAAAHEAAARIEAAAASAVTAARGRLARVAATARDHAAACYAAASALAAADREAAERHAERARVDACVAELAERLGPSRPDEPAEVAAARDRLEHARAHLAAPPPQPYAWIDGWRPEVAGAMLRDLPDEDLERARPAMRRLADEDDLLALAAAGESVVALTADRMIVATATGDESYPPATAGEARPAAATADEARAAAPAAPDPLLAGLAERRPGRLGAVLELVRAAGAAGPAAPPPPDRRDDPVELLRRLGELRERGVISADEFAVKKAELLRRI
jgi:Short C-terminal domain